MHIPFTATNFPASWFPTPLPTSLPVTWSDLVWSAVTSGKAGSSYLLSHGWHSLADLVIRSHTIYANLRQGTTGCERSSLYEGQDPSEKGATSYFLGMTMAKLFAGIYFDTPWLFHLSYASFQGVSVAFLPGSSSRPDLIGTTTSGNWIIVEAKGRSGGFNSDALIKAKGQTKMISLINGSPPVLSVALQAYFKGARLHVSLEDPPERDPSAIDVDMDLPTAMRRYYALAVAVTSLPTQDRTLAGQRYVTRFDRDSGITIGIDRSMLDLVNAGKMEELRNSARNRSVQDRANSQGTTMYPDGLLVSLDDRWSQERMRKEPELR